MMTKNELIEDISLQLQIKNAAAASVVNAFPDNIKSNILTRRIVESTTKTLLAKHYNS